MSPRARQLFAFSAVLLFVVVATFVTLRANGWQWAGWRQGFVPSGVIVISSSPRSSVAVNGRTIGLTPRRISGLAPGIYQIKLSAAGVQPWQQYLQVEAQRALVIGPVILLPHAPTMSAIAGSPTNIILTDDKAKAFVPTGDASPLGYRQIWPVDEHLIFSMPAKPDSLLISPHDQLIAATINGQTVLSAPSSTDQTWAVPTLAGIFWLPGSDQVIYGLRAGQLWRVDTVNQTQSIVGPAEQAGSFGQDLWRSTIDKNQTIVWRQPSFSAAAPREILRRTGIFFVSNGPSGVIELRDTTSQETIFAVFPANGLPKILDVGSTTEVVWPSLAQSPLWIRDFEIWTLDGYDQPELLDRRSMAPQLFGWLSSPDILTTVDAYGLSISSVSDRQGRGGLLAAPTGTGQTILSLAANRREALVAGPDDLQVWQW